MNGRTDYAAALDDFQAAVRSGVATRLALQSKGHDDGETENLVWMGRIHAIYCLGRLDPLAALDEMTKLRRPPLPGDPPPELWQVPPDLVTQAGVGLMQFLPERFTQSAQQPSARRWLSGLLRRFSGFRSKSLPSNSRR
jgi:hypothetical protein